MPTRQHFESSLFLRRFLIPPLVMIDIESLVDVCTYIYVVARFLLRYCDLHGVLPLSNLSSAKIFQTKVVPL